MGDYKNGTVFGWQKLYVTNPVVTITSSSVAGPPNTSTYGTIGTETQAIGTPIGARGRDDLRHESPSRTGVHTPLMVTRG